MEIKYKTNWNDVKALHFRKWHRVIFKDRSGSWRWRENLLT